MYKTSIMQSKPQVLRLEKRKDELSCYARLSFHDHPILSLFSDQ